MLREDERVSNDHVLPARGCEHDDLRDVIRRQRLHAPILHLWLGRDEMSPVILCVNRILTRRPYQP